ncbi:MAG: hypothetical protein KFH87_03130 [Bacteroidetes bacterium]|nr:hypothetical protein [Bacteroidota bacterium]
MYLTYVIQPSHTEKRLLARLKEARPADSILARCEDEDRCVRLYRDILVRAAQTIDRAALTLETRLEQALQQVPLPERALVHLHRFLEASLSPARILEHILRTPRLLTDFLLLSSSSLWLADALVRDAGLFRWLLATDVLEQAPSDTEILAGARSALVRFDRSELRMNALRRYQRRQLLRIASADILQKKPLTVVVRELSDLADAVLVCALDEAVTLHGQRRGRPPAARIAVIALGKLGGRELNYSSDIDIMFVYDRMPAVETHREADARCEPADRRAIADEAEDAAQLAPPDTVVSDDAVTIVKELLRLLTGSSSEGMLYRTDLRLRPDGAAGAPALSLDATVTYYERRGALWERQMLLRSRTCAGDRILGEMLLRRLEPFVYPRGTRRLPSELLVNIHTRLSGRWHDERNVKHMRGGIRHIEFSLQAIQMVHAQLVSLRTPSTLESISACAARGLLQPEEEALLRDAYVFLRRVEHALQLEQFEQTHTLPGNDTGMLRVSRTLGFETHAMFHRRLRRTRSSVERICDGILAAETDDNRGEVQPSSPIPTDDPRLRTILRDLVDGREDARRSSNDRRRMDTLLPALLADASATPLPVEALAGIEQFTYSAAPAGALSYIEHQQTRQFLLHLAACAPVALRRLERDPLLLELVFSGWDEQHLNDARLYDVSFVSALATLILGDSDIDAFGRAISEIADTVLRRTLLRLHDASFPFAVLALGKYGSAELIPGSDLDVIFLYDTNDDADHERAQKYGRAVIREMRGDRVPPLFECDTRLRPEGRSAPLAVSITAWQRYFQERASLWERQSLLRSRLVAGDAGLMARISKAIHAQRMTRTLTADDLAEIRAMRLRMEADGMTRQASRIDIKRAPGGLIDAEFAAQVLQLHAAALPAGGTSPALSQAARLFPSLSDAVTRLRHHHCRLRLLQLFLRLLLDTPSNHLPPEKERSHRLAAVMGIEGSEGLTEELSMEMRQARIDFDFVFETVSSMCASQRAGSNP